MAGDEIDDGHGAALRSLRADELDPRVRVLLDEAARIADRLDALDQIVAGKGVLQLLRFRLCDDEGRVAEVKFDHVLAEARQQAGALRQILTTLGVDKIAAAQAGSGGSILDEFTRRREEREAAAAAAHAAGVDERGSG